MESNPNSFRNLSIFSNLDDSFCASLWGCWISQGWLKDPPGQPRSLNGEPRNRGVVGDDLCWSFGGDGRREFSRDGRKCVTNSGVSGISAIGFNFLQDFIRKTHSYLNLLKSYLNTYFSRFKKEFLSRVLLI